MPACRFTSASMAWRQYRALGPLSLVALLGGSSQALAAQKTYQIGHFSDEFRATLAVEDSSDVFRPGSVSVFASPSGQRLLRVASDELTLELEHGQVPANIKELPYGRQSVLIYEDFDFDGRRDLAIMGRSEILLPRALLSNLFAARGRLRKECDVHGAGPRLLRHVHGRRAGEAPVQHDEDVAAAGINSTLSTS